MNTTPSLPLSTSTASTSTASSSTARALVLGGGGAVGNAWLIGVVAGLADAGLDVAGADLIVGTSAGSTAAVQLTGATPSDLLAAALEPAPPPRDKPRPAEPPGNDSPRNTGSVSDHLERTNRIIAAAHDPAQMRRDIGAAARAMDAASDEAAQARWRATVAGRLPGRDWPERRLLITAVDAVSGDPVVFDRDGGIDLVDAVAASCAGGFAYRIGDRQFIDGGYRSNADNADLAAGYRRVLVLSPFGGRSRFPAGWGLQLAAQVDDLRRRGSDVETVLPDGEARAAFGDTMMDLSARPAAVRAGHRQGTVLAARLAAFWR